MAEINWRGPTFLITIVAGNSKIMYGTKKMSAIKLYRNINVIPIPFFFELTYLMPTERSRASFILEPNEFCFAIYDISDLPSSTGQANGTTIKKSDGVDQPKHDEQTLVNLPDDLLCFLGSDVDQFPLVA